MQKSKHVKIEKYKYIKKKDKLKIRSRNNNKITAKL